MNERTAVLVRCTKEEARRIREAAEQEHRTISGFILNIVIGHIDRSAETKRKIKERMEAARKKP